MAFILTTPQFGASSNSNDSITPDIGVINANSSLTIDNVDTTISNTVKWFIEITDITNTKMRSFEIYAINRFNTISYNRTNTIGDPINFVESVVMNGTNTNLNIANNEAVDLNYKLIRIQI